MQIPEEVRIFRQQIGAENGGVTRRQIKDCGIVADAGVDLAGLHPARLRHATIRRGERG